MLYEKVFQTQEPPERGYTSCAYYRTTADGIFPMHCHNHYEMSFVVSGSRYEICGGKSYLLSDGGLLFVPSFAFHANKNITPVDVMVIQFSPKILYWNTIKVKNPTLVRPQGASLSVSLSRNALGALMKIADFCRDGVPATASSALRRGALIQEFLAVLIDDGELMITDGANLLGGMPQLDKVINHILAHPESRTDMKQAAKLANMSYYAFSRQFKEAVGINFSDYCNIIRIRLAEELLITTRLSVSEIAEKTGIGTQSYFSRLFRQQNGMSPKEYRASFGLDYVK